MARTIVKTSVDGKLTLDKKHHYQHVDFPKAFIPGVTSLTGQIDKSDALMGWALKLCVEHLREGFYEGITEDGFGKLVDEARTAHYRANRKAADIGTSVHDWAEAYLRGKESEATIPDKPDEVAKGCQAFVSWVKDCRIQFLAAERMVFHRGMIYAGTCDFIGTIDKKLVIGDFKTSKAIYPEYHLQTLAYALALAEEKDLPEVSERVLIHLPKDGGDFSVQWSDPERYDEEFDAFVGLRNLWRWRKGN